jgi:Phage tail lysozyme
MKAARRLMGAWFALVLLIVLVAVAVFGSQSDCDPTPASGSLPSPPPGQLSAAQMVEYLESAGESANAAAGIVGNLTQESGLNPAESDGAGGGGLAQWNASWYRRRGPHGEQSLDAFASSRGLAPASDSAQLMYLAYDLRVAFTSLLAKLDTAPDPATAATMFETGYEDCSGVAAFMQVTPGSPCMDGNRRAYALAALQQAGGTLAAGAGSAIPASYTIDGTCAADASFLAGRGLDPIPGFRPGRDDMGVDACATPGEPIIAPAASTLVQVIPDWFDGEPLMLFHFNQPLPGTFYNDQYWYVAEEIDPVTVQTQTVFEAREVVAHFAPTGTCIEIGWGSPTANARTLADQEGDAAAAGPPAGSLTQWGETFKRYFEIPWVGVSP